MAAPPNIERSSSPQGDAWEVFRVFLMLGLTSFGGPIAHIGYLREAFVQRRGWLDEAGFAQLLAVCQFLPGPASSQMGFAIGLFRAGWRGALAAFAGFTLPSAILMLAFATLSVHLGAGMGGGVLHGLKLVAVVVVAHGLLGMAQRLTPDIPRLLIAALVVALVLSTQRAWMQLGGIALGGVLGLVLCRRAPVPDAAQFPVRHGGRGAAVCLGLFLAGLAVAIATSASGPPTPGGIAAAFYRAGALVFGGGHVVLPLLQASLVGPGWLAPDTFLAGYGAAQAVPGPMFSLAAFLGAEVPVGLAPVAAGLIALVAMFVPGFLLLLAVLPVWSGLVRHRRAAQGMAGVNAAVVGLLAAAFWDPVVKAGVGSLGDLVVALVGFGLLAGLRLSPLWVVAWCVAGTVALRAWG